MRLRLNVYALAGALGLICTASISAQPTAAEGDALFQQMIASAKELGSSSLPDRNQLGAEWKLAWELPPTAESAVKTEEEYWQKVSQQMGIAGVSEDYARKMIDAVSAQIAAQGAAEGLTARDGVITLLMQERSTNSPTATKVAEGYAAGARAFALAQAQQAQGLNRQEAAKRAPRVILDLVSEPFKGQSDEQLKQLYAKEVSLIQKRTEMSYFKSNNWAGLAQAKSDEEIARRGIWLGVVKVNLMLADPERTEEPLDLRAEDAPKLESQLVSAVRACVQGGVEMRRKEVQAEIDRQTQMGDTEAAQRTKEKFDREAAAANQIAAKVVMKKFGDNSYVVRITGISPDLVGMKFGMYTAWIRKGPAMVEISLGGNFPEDQMNVEMDRFLSEMDAKLASYDSSPAGALKLAAPALPAPAAQPPAVAGNLPSGNQPQPQPQPPAQPQPQPQPRPPVQPPANRDPPAGSPNPQPRAPAPSDPAQAAKFAQATQLYNSGDMRSAMAAFEELVRSDPNSSQAVLMRGACKYYSNDLKGALADYRAACKLNPADMKAREYRAFLYLCTGDAKSAAEHADALLASNPADVDAMLTRAQATVHLAPPAEAQQWFARVAAADPNRAASLYAEAGNALQRGMHTVAGIQFNSVLWLNPGYYQAWYGYGSALAAQGYNDKAIDAFQNYLKSDQTSDYARQARAEIDRLSRHR